MYSVLLSETQTKKKKKKKKDRPPFRACMMFM